MLIETDARRERKIGAHPDKHPAPLGIVDVEVVLVDPALLQLEMPAIVFGVARSGQNAGGLASLLAQPNWHEDRVTAEAMRAPLMRLCARFLLAEKAGQGRALDLVEHFHLTNGARVERLNWLADLSPKGLQQAAGAMVNYLYRLGEVETNHEAYTGEGRVAASATVKALARLKDNSRSR